MRPDSLKDGPLATLAAWPKPQGSPVGTHVTQHPVSAPHGPASSSASNPEAGHTWEQHGPFTKRFGEGHHQLGTEGALSRVPA